MISAMPACALRWPPTTHPSGNTKNPHSRLPLALEVDQFCDSAWRILLHNYKEMADKTHYDTTIANRDAVYQSRGPAAPPLDV